MGNSFFHQWKASGAVALAGAAILAGALISPGGKASVPGWKPVNDQVMAALDAAASPSLNQATASPTPAGSSAPFVAAAGDEPPSASAAAVASPSVSAPPAPPSAPSAPATPLFSPPASAASPPSNAAGLLNLNAATAEQLDELKGIGPSKAKAIVSYREQNGPFRSVEDLLNVKGIGEKLLAGIRADVTV